MKNNTIKRNIVGYLKFNSVFIFDDLFKSKNIIFGVINGGVFLIIILNKKKKASPKQKEMMNQINEIGGISFLAYCCEDVEFELKNYFL